ncbi:MAG: transporter substrate-binding domain-containing protein [Hydrogenophaga sp.]|uniref:transporter substrate-binding domain-containing protein n=1 Tax=Hydrogenophaga sp. TaxID=1904254 RepID=UPI00276AFDF2|nr:transporter substrate-binding domain-containing protein [Hydrogenophaga sp.]MDP2418342.1 transporter substrate-binding domain-containing protein [Hydrogenophaga sp.]MDZ4187024.1 transporter substrate-binding domain-containing protein [Hydrogenophaga sp.]
MAAVFPLRSTIGRFALGWCLLSFPAWDAAPANPLPQDPPALRLAVERDYPPFVFVGPNLQTQGLSIDMLRLVQETTGLRVAEQPAAPLETLLSDLRQGKADLITSLRPTPERAEFLEFTRPYIQVPAILVVRSGHAPLTTAKALTALQGRPVAVGHGYAVEAVMRKNHPLVAWQAVSDDTQALKGVADGRFEAAVADAASVSYIVQNHELKGLHSAGRVGFDYDLSFGIRQGQPGLRERMDAGILAVPRQERQAVMDRWLQALEAETMGRAPTWPAVLGTGLLGGGLLLLGWKAWRPTAKPPHA